MKRFSVLLSLLLLPCLLAAAPVPPPEKLLPADTLAVFTVPEYGKTKAQSEKWPASQWWNDPSMKPFKDKFMGKLRSEVIAPMEKEFGLKLSDYYGLAQGQMTMAITRGAWDGSNDETPGFVLLMDTRDKSDVLKTNLASFKKKWVDAGKQIRSEKIREVEFTTLIFNSDDFSKTLEKIFPDPNAGNETLEAPKPKKPGKKLEWFLGQSDTLMVLGSSAKDIEKILINQGGGGVPPLSEQANFAPGFNSQFRDALGYGWIHLKPVVEAATKAAEKAQAGKPEARGGGTPAFAQILSALGIGGLQTASFSIRETPEGSLVNFNLNIPEAARKGLFKLFSFETKDANPPPFVPADAVKFSRVRLDLQKTWNTLEATIVEAMPQAAGVIKLVLDNAGKDKDPDFDLRKQLIANLGDDMISYQKNPRKQTLADLNAAPTLILISSPKPETLASSFKALTAVMPMQGKIKERDFLGRKVYSMNLPGTPAPGGGKPVEKSLHYAASGGFVAMTTDVATLEEFMRSGEGAGKALRDLPGLADAAQKVGGYGTGMFGFENQAETMRNTLETLKKESGTLANLFAGSPLAGRLGMDDDSKKFKEWIDFSLLPSWDRISKYFHITVWAGSVTPEGFALKAYGPNPPQLKK
jgi:hypothetical protein